MDPIIEFLTQTVATINAINAFIVMLSTTKFPYELFIALVALYVAIYQSILDRRHNRLSVKPLLRIDTIQDFGKSEISLVNAGTGPAIIKSVKIIVRSSSRVKNETEFNGSTPDWGEKVRKILFENNFVPQDLTFRQKGIRVDDILSPNDQFKLFIYSANDNKLYVGNEFFGNTIIHFLKIKVTYMSIYNEKFSLEWTVN